MTQYTGMIPIVLECGNDPRDIAITVSRTQWKCAT